MTAPVWMNAVIGDFGRAAGLGGFALKERGAAALRFENGSSLRFEYTGTELLMAMTKPSADVKRLLALSHPKARYGFRIRTGILAKTHEAVIAVRIVFTILSVASSPVFTSAGICRAIAALYVSVLMCGSFRNTSSIPCAYSSR